MASANLDAAKALFALADYLERLPLIGAEVYANGARRGDAIVDHHFKSGNQSRYGWAPLNRDYFRRKQGLLKGKVRKGVYFPGKGKKGSKLDQKAEFRSSTGAMSGIGSGTNAPMLVASGLSRAAVAAGGHTISLEGDVAFITFRGLPDYDEYLHTGTSKMPKRSPVEPCTEDVIEVEAEMEKALSAECARLGLSPVSRSTVPSQARII